MCSWVGVWDRRQAVGRMVWWDGLDNVRLGGCGLSRFSVVGTGRNSYVSVRRRRRGLMSWSFVLGFLFVLIVDGFL